MQKYFDDYKIFIDGNWSLEDLYKFPRAYEQVYFAYEALLPSDGRIDEQRIDRAFNAFPWRGGYSAVNFYNQLKFVTPRSQRPKIKSIQYASPGWIEIFLNLPLAVHIGSVVFSIAGTIKICNSTYHKIYIDLQSRKLLRMDVEKKSIELTRENMKLVEESSETLSKIIGLESSSALVNRTEDPLVALKILVSVYRRIKTLTEYQNNGKADLRPNIYDDIDF